MKEFQKLDAIVIGAGFAGIQLLYQLREDLGLNVHGFEAQDDVGGVWNNNRYPGAKCDSPGVYYTHVFSKELYKEWKWSTPTFPGQEEIQKYHSYAAERLDVRKDFSFNTKVTSAVFDHKSNTWIVETSKGGKYEADFIFPCIGVLTIAHAPKLEGINTFKGKVYHTSDWPKKPIEFKGKKVGIFGTGSSGVQAIPELAETAESLTVFQRTPQYVTTLDENLITHEMADNIRDNFDPDTIRSDMRASPMGVPGVELKNLTSALEVTEEEREKVYERAWKYGGGAMLYAFSDVRTDEEANKTVQEFIRKKIKEIVKDPETARKLLPDYLFGAKRPIMGDNYYEIYNLDHVNLVALKEEPVKKVTENGIQTTANFYDLDIIIFATGFDAFTGPLSKLNVKGVKGRSFVEKWENGYNVSSFLGMMYSEFPNLFTIGGPHFAFTVNAAPNIDYKIEYILDIVRHMKKTNTTYVEVTEEAEENWVNYCREIDQRYLFSRVDSWYNGANIEGKPKGLYGFPGSFQEYLHYFESVKNNDYKGIRFSTSQPV